MAIQNYWEYDYEGNPYVYDNGGSPVGDIQTPLPPPQPNYLDNAANEATNPFPNTNTNTNTGRPTTRYPDGSRPGSPGQGAVWNDDYWDGRSAHLGGWLIPDGTSFRGPQPPPGPMPSGGDASGGDASGFAWPKFNAPSYQAGSAFQGPATPFDYEKFSYDAFEAPKFADIYQDGSYQGRRDEGLQAIEHGAAAKGLSRLPQTLKALSGWNQDFASREYGNIWDRSANTYDRNRGNAFGNWQANRSNAADAYSLNYGVSRDVWDRGEKQSLDKFDRNYRGASDMFDFNQFQPAKSTFSDLYNRWKSELDATTNIATAGAGY